MGASTRKGAEEYIEDITSRTYGDGEASNLFCTRSLLSQPELILYGFQFIIWRLSWRYMVLILLAAYAARLNQ